jgi:hypothetical protein
MDMRRETKEQKRPKWELLRISADVQTKYIQVLIEVMPVVCITEVTAYLDLPQQIPLNLIKCLCVMLVSWLAYSSTLKKEATCFSEMSVDFQRATRYYIPEDRTLHVTLSLHFNYFAVIVVFN